MTSTTDYGLGKKLNSLEGGVKVTKCRYCKRDIEDGTTLCGSAICAAKRELNEYRYRMMECEHLAETLEELLCRIRSCTKAYDACGGGGTKRNTFEDQMAKYIDLKDTYEKMQLETYRKALSVECKIRKLDSPYDEILRLKYINRWTFEKIAVELNYYFRHVQRLHDKALKKYLEL